jgi:dihydrofolate reductase
VTTFLLYVATSIDGYIARTDESVDWLLPPPEEVDKDKNYINFYNSIDGLVMGSTTYEQILGFGDWPYPGKLSYVLTSRDLSTTRTDVAFVKDVETVVEETKNRGYERVWLVGGGKVASSFIEKGLVDDFFIFIVPILLGSGISLYQSIPELKLKLVNTQSYPYGVVELHYQRTDQ